MKRISFVSFLTAGFLLAGLAVADVINVPEDQQTIQSAITAADEGDTVLVQPGVYEECIDFSGKNIAVASLTLTTGDPAWIDSTIIDGNQQGSVVAFRSHETNDALLTGFTLRNGRIATGGGIYIDNASPTLTWLKVADNTATSNGGGIAASYTDSLVISHCRFQHNTSSNMGGGAHFYMGHIFLEECVFIDNSGGPGGGLSVYNAGTEAFFHGGLIQGNQSAYGGGLWMLCGSTATFDQIDFVDNTATYGGAIYIYGGSSLNLSYGLIAGNAAQNAGGGIYLAGTGEKNFVNCTFSGNTAPNGDAILTTNHAFDVTYLNCIIFANGDDAILLANRTNTFDYCDVEGGEDGIDVSGGNLVWGDGNIDEDPRFASVECGDYSIQLDSPCLDAGDPESPLDADHSRADMGAYPLIRSSRMYGLVCDAATGSPLPNVVISVSNGAGAVTGDQGEYNIPTFAGDFDVVFSLPGYNDHYEAGLNLPLFEAREYNVEMLHPEFLASDWNMSVNVNLGSRCSVPLTISNPANGPLEWSVEFQTETGESVESWERRESVLAGQITGDSFIEGVVFTGEYYAVSGRGDGTPMIYILNRDGEMVNQFPSPGDEGSRGMRGLAWDGELVWGSGCRTVFGFNLEGEVVHQWEGPCSRNTNITWDADRELLWICDTTTDILGYTRSGERQAIIRRQGLQIYGLTYWSEDPDGCSLYVTHKLPDKVGAVVAKVNPEVGEFQPVCDFADSDDADFKGGIITRQFDRFGGWVMIVATNLSVDRGGDRLDVYQLQSNLYFIDFDAPSGVIQAGREDDVFLEINTVSDEGLSLPLGNIEGCLVFTHNAEGGETRIPLALRVVMPDGAPSAAAALPDQLAITGLYPNPFNSVATVDYTIAEPSFTRIGLYDLSGRLVSILAEGRRAAGTYTASINGGGLPSGMYVVRLTSDGQNITRKITLMK